MQAIPLTQDEYRAYGDVIEARADVKPVTANLGFARRHNFLAPISDLRPGRASPNLCVFRCDPMVPPGGTQFDVKLLERHEHSTQAFIPMNGVRRYLVLVALGGDSPDIKTLKAFMATGSQGITYRPGIWHHPLVALDQVSDFTCLVYECGDAGDCEVARLGKTINVTF